MKPKGRKLIPLNAGIHPAFKANAHGPRHQQNGKQNSFQNKQNKRHNKTKSVSTPRGLFAPRELLEGPNLRKSVEQIVNLQTRPAIRQANRGIAEATKQREFDISREKNLGLQAGRNITSYYQKLAEDETQKFLGMQQAQNEAKAGIADSGRETLAGIQSAGEGVAGGLGEYEGQSIASRDRLAEMIATQGATAANQNNALNAQASGS